MNGSAAYADIDSGVAVAVMRNRFTTGDVAAVARIDRIIAEYPTDWDQTRRALENRRVVLDLDVAVRSPQELRTGSAIRGR